MIPTSRVLESRQLRIHQQSRIPGRISCLLRTSSGRSTDDHGPRPPVGWVIRPVERNELPNAGTGRQGKPEACGMD